MLYYIKENYPAEFSKLENNTRTTPFKQMIDIAKQLKVERLP